MDQHLNTTAVFVPRIAAPDRRDARTRSAVRSLLLLNAVGGAAVLYSYYAGMVGTGAVGAALWGGVPDSLRGLYTANMFLAAAGYFLFTPYLIFRVAPDAIASGEHARLARIGLYYALVLLPSALWLPLTAQVIAEPSTAAWLTVRVDLLLVAAGAIGLLAETLVSRPRGAWSRRLAILGLLPFCLQVAVLDALIWPAYFPAAA